MVPSVWLLMGLHNAVFIIVVRTSEYSSWNSGIGGGGTSTFDLGVGVFWALFSFATLLYAGVYIRRMGVRGREERQQRAEISRAAALTRRRQSVVSLGGGGRMRRRRRTEDSEAGSNNTDTGWQFALLARATFGPLTNH